MAVYPERRNGGKLSGAWIAEVTVAGERRRRRFPAQKDGERWADFIKLTGLPPPETTGVVDENTFGSVAKEALEHHAGWQSDRDPSRGQRLEYVIGVIRSDTPITAVRTTDYDRLVQSLKGRPGVKGKLTGATINRYLAVASAVLAFARKRAYVIGTPVVPWQEEDGHRVHWLPEEAEDSVAAFMLSCGQREAALTLRVLIATGLRWGEFESLTPDMIVGEWVKLDKTKTNTPRDVPIDPFLAGELRTMLAEKRSPPYYTFRKLLKAALKSAGQSEALTVHCLRHTTATRLVHAGVNLSVVKDYLGHSSLTTTLKYTHVTASLLADASKILSPRAGHSIGNGDARGIGYNVPLPPPPPPDGG
jgi:integrase